jgi:hypothetical protein
LSGKRIALADLQGTSTLVLFWNPDCGFCQRMLTELKSWERRRPAGSPQLLLVSTGTIEANRAMGLSSPVLFDPDGVAMRDFGASGTPVAILVDDEGRIASALATGEHEVMSLARSRQTEPARM